MPRDMPVWLAKLNDEDLHFIRRFVLASGSLKELGKQYSVSYPTLRGRLDRLIEKINAIEDPKTTDEFERDILVLIADGRLATNVAKSLLKSHRSSMAKNSKSKGKKK